MERAELHKGANDGSDRFKSMKQVEESGMCVTKVNGMKADARQIWQPVGKLPGDEGKLMLRVTIYVVEPQSTNKITNRWIGGN